MSETDTKTEVDGAPANLPAAPGVISGIVAAGTTGGPGAKSATLAIGTIGTTGATNPAVETVTVAATHNASTTILFSYSECGCFALSYVVSA